MSAQTENQVNDASTVTPAKDEPVINSTVTDTLNQLILTADAQSKSLREMQKQLKGLTKAIAKDYKKMAKASKLKTKRVVKQRPVLVNTNMNKFMKDRHIEQHQDGGGFTRQVMMRAVSAYIKEKDIQVQSNRKQWKPDVKLQKLFSLDKKQLYTFMNINGLISRVVTKKPEPKK